MKVSEHMLCKIIIDLFAYSLIEKLERMFTFLEKIIRCMFHVLKNPVLHKCKNKR